MALVRYPQRQWPRGPLNALHQAARDGSIERTVALLSSGSIDVDRGNPQGDTPLMFAAMNDFLPIARLLLNKRANVSITNDEGFTALHMAAQEGHLAFAKLLVDAGADLEAASPEGITPLHNAASEGHSEMVSALIKAGAKINSRFFDGATPLFCAVRYGCLGATRVLLRAKADPLLTTTDNIGEPHVPLDMAAQGGHSEVVRELIHQLDIEGCGGATGGVEALKLAARNQHIGIMAMLMDAGVVDTSAALHTAAKYGCTEAVKFLLQQREDKSEVGVAPYVNARGSSGVTALALAVVFAGFASARVARLLVDAGADTTSAVPLLLAPGADTTSGVRIATDAQGRAVFHDTPLALTTFFLHTKKSGVGKDAAEEQLQSLRATRRLLLRVEAVRAVSWLWPSDPPSVVPAAAEGARGGSTAFGQLATMLPISRRRARRPRVFLGALCRLVMGVVLVCAVMALAVFVERTRV